MKLILITGNGAVGKMTVGQELAKITDLRLNYNHMTIDPVFNIFGYVDWEVVFHVRKLIFEAFAKSENSGMITTFMWAFDDPTAWDMTEEMIRPFRDVNAEIYCLELLASQSVRLERNATENRLSHKPSKRNLEASNKIITDMDAVHRFESLPGEVEGGRIPFAGYFKVDNTHVSAAEVAQMAKEKFNL